MKNDDRKIQIYEYALHGFLLGMVPLSLQGIHAGNPLLGQTGTLIVGITAAFLLGLGLSMIFRHPRWGRSFCTGGILLELFLLYFEFLSNPLLALLCLLAASGGLYYLFTARIRPAETLNQDLRLNRFLGSGWALLVLTMLSPILGEFRGWGFKTGCLISFLWMLCGAWAYLRHRKKQTYQKTIRTGAVLAVMVAGYLTWTGHIMLASWMAALAALVYIHNVKHADTKLLEVILLHPARCLMLTFLALCSVGTLLLRTPAAMQQDLPLLSAAFTAVSGVCVTGLTVIDISRELTLCGRFFLLLLIQLGGLGIMTLTSLVLHTLGRLSLQQEQLISELTPEQERHRDVFRNLHLIVRFTFLVEAAGALLLTLGFYSVHGNWLQALELGIFTSVSAFCNAGFFPGADNLVPYAGEPFLLLVVAFLIIAGGIAPAVTCSLLQFRSFRKLPVVCKLIFGTTAALLLGGTFFLLLFEWNGMFQGMSLMDKLVNCFFQSATLRTAGFNTVSFTAIGVPSYLVMLILMFIGGSPGGTAGGIKTTTLAVLALAFRAAVQNKDVVTVDQRTVPFRIVTRAVAIFFAAALVLMIVIMMLVTTQALGVKEVIFEAVSALATVGVSMGITAELDAVGKVVIMAAMFIGRIGPLTLFLLLSDRRTAQHGIYPPTEIPLA